MVALLQILYAGFPGSVQIPNDESCVGRDCHVRFLKYDHWTDPQSTEHQVLVAVAEVKGDCHACAAILGVGQFVRPSANGKWQSEIQSPAVTRVGGYGQFAGKVFFADGGPLGRVVLVEDGGGGQGVFSNSVSLVIAVGGVFREILVIPTSLSVELSCNFDDPDLCQKR